MVVLTVFAFFPIAVVQIAFRQIEGLEVEKIIQARNIFHEKLLSKLKAADDDVLMVTRLVRRLARRAGELSPRAAINLMKRAQKRFPGCWDIYLFDRAGKVIPELSSHRDGSGICERALKIVWAKDISIPVSYSQDGLLQSFLRITSPIELGRFGKRDVTLGDRGRDTYFTYDFFDNSGCRIGGMMAFLHRQAFRPDRAVRNAIRLVNRKSQISKVGYIDFGPTRLHSFPRSLRKIPDLRARLMAALAGYERHFSGEGFRGSLINRGLSSFFVAVAPLPRFFSNGTWVFTHLLCLCWFLLVAFWGPVAGKSFLARISIKVVALFLFALVVPFVLLQTGGYYVLKDHGNVLMANLENQIREKLQQFDDRVPIELNRLEAVVRGEIDRSRRFSHQEDRSRVYDDLVKKESIFDLMYAIDLHGKVVYEYPPLTTEIRPDIKKRNELFIRLNGEMLKRINNKMTFNPSSVMLEMTEGLFNSLLGGDFDLNVMTSSLGRFMPFSIGDESSFQLFEALFDEHQEAYQIISVLLSRSRFERSFVTRFLPNLLKQSDLSWRLAVIGENPNLGNVCPETSDLRQAKEIALEVNQKKSNARAIIVSGSDERLWFGMRGKNLSGFTFVASVSTGPVRKRISLLWNFFIGVTLMLVLSTAIIGDLLSKELVGRIGELNKGIAEYTNGNYEYCIPTLFEDELDKTAESLNHLARLFGERDRMMKYLSRSTIESIKTSQESALGGKCVPATILFCDIRSFTTISESFPAKEVVGLLNSYFSLMAGIITAHAGDIDKFIGDAIMAVFTSAEGMTVPSGDLASRAICCGLEMMKTLETFNRDRRGQGELEIAIGIGINSGDVIQGNIGAPGRMEHTVIGDAVNVASRLEGMTKLGRHTRIIISQSTLDLVKRSVEVEKLEETSLKGKTQAVAMYEIIRWLGDPIRGDPGNSLPG